MRRGVCASVLCVAFGAATATGASAAAWGPAVPVSPDGVDVGFSSGVQTPQGTRVLALGVPDATQVLGLQLGVVAPGAPGPGTGTVLGGAPAYSSRPVSDAEGAVSVLWTGPLISGERVQHVTTRTAAGARSSMAVESSAGARATAIDVGRDGDVAVAWSEDDGADEVVRVVVRRKGDAAFGPVSTVLRGKDGGDGWGSLSVAVLDGGDVLVAWEHDATSSLLGGLGRDGAVRAQQALTSGRWAQRPTLTSDGARALVTWIEGPSSDRSGPRDVRFAVATSSGLGPDTTVGTGRQGADGDPPVVAARGGKAVVAWSSAYHDDLGTHGLGARTVDVDLLTGAATPSVPVTRSGGFDPQVYEDPAALALTADGRALLALDGYQPSVAERAAGARSFENPVPVSCRAGITVLVGDESGVPTITWSDERSVAAVRRVYVSRRDAAVAQTCPRPRRGPFADPEQPRIGQETTLDASGIASADAPTEWSWDVDGDGEFELDWAQRPVVRHVFTTTGNHVVGVRVRFRTARGYTDGGGWVIQLHNVLPPAVAWPDAVPTRPAPVPPRRAPAAAAPAVVAPRVRGSLGAPRAIRLATLARRGVLLRVRSPRAGSLRVVATGSGFRTLRATRRVAADRTTTLRVRPKRTRTCRTRSVALRLRVVAPGGSTFTRTTTVRCRS